jgi:beta-glucanase (GH16 family)
MVSLWMVGLEDQPDRCGEICVMEVFGDAIVPGESTAVGMGLKTIRDPAVPQDFEAVRLPIDLADFHTYAVQWASGEATFFVDGAPIRSCSGAPTYPMQLMLAVFDFPENSRGDDAHLVPAFVVDHIRGWNVAEELVA